MRIDRNGKLVRHQEWYSSSPPDGVRISEPPIIDSTVSEAVEMIARASGRQPSTVTAVAYVEYREDGLVDVTAFGRLVRFRPSTPRETRKAAKNAAVQAAERSQWSKSAQ